MLIGNESSREQRERQQKLAERRSHRERAITSAIASSDPVRRRSASADRDRASGGMVDRPKPSAPPPHPRHADKLRGSIDSLDVKPPPVIQRHVWTGLDSSDDNRGCVCVSSCGKAGC